MIVTLTIVFVFNTGVGLAVGIGLSLVIAAADAFLSEPYDPVIKEISVPSDANLQAAAAVSSLLTHNQRHCLTRLISRKAVWLMQWI